MRKYLNILFKKTILPNRSAAGRRCRCWPSCGPPGFRASCTRTPASKLQKQLKYADAKGIPLVLLLGPEELAAGVVKVKIMQSGTEKVLRREQVVEELTAG